jgi:hypothetical protein
MCKIMLLLESVKGGDDLGDLGVDGRKILK